ncbi:hypothetical protein [Magnetovibrio sp.]|uniref:hypothetical protein n=1 Tax=Magnetovibrio sp. TaxID=2024836 RepID=UPI002F95388C
MTTALNKIMAGLEDALAHAKGNDATATPKAPPSPCCTSSTKNRKRRCGRCMGEG